ncbi:hypothetical protein L218DRAFT_176817 [Marasmius fiardii PR-910]|nr:hypothetical protein L218DRAFT_176817 [Marasmius fiardii PR-910]
MDVCGELQALSLRLGIPLPTVFAARTRFPFRFTGGIVPSSSYCRSIYSCQPMLSLVLPLIPCGFPWRLLFFDPSGILSEF